MATIKKFEDVEAWVKARSISKDVFILSKKGDFAKDFRFRDQINSSSGSIMDNIAEGFDRGGKAEFVNFLSYSKGSCGELKAQLYRALDREYINNDSFNDLYNRTDEVGKMIGGLMTYLNESELKGQKFKNRVN